MTWTDSGEVGRNPMYRYIAFFMDKLMGSTFERSLTKLKALAETAH